MTRLTVLVPAATVPLVVLAALLGPPSPDAAPTLPVPVSAAVVPPGPPSPDRPGRLRSAAVLDLGLTTANIRSGEHPMPQPDVVDDVAAVAAATPDGGALLLQEIIPARYRAAVRERFRDREIVAIRTTSVPIVVPRGWTVRGSGHVLVHRGRPDAGPDRFVSWAVVRPGGSGTTGAVALLNTHFVHAAWNGRPDRWDPWRKDRWRAHHVAVERIVASFVARGIPVLGGGDFNRTVRRGLRPFHPDQRWLHSDGGIDKLFWVPAGGADVSVDARDLTPLHSDHDARTARLRLVLPTG